MKKLLLFITLFFLVNSAHGQVQNFFSATYDHYKFKGAPGYASFGLSAEQMFGKHLGFQLDVSGGKDNFQSGIGLLTIPLLALSQTPAVLTDNDGNFSLAPLLFTTIFSLLSMERINFHINIAPEVQLIPYVSVFRIRYMYNTTYKEYWFSSWSTGLKLSLVRRNKWFVNAHCERSQLYATGTPSAIQAGLSVGYIFQSRIIFFSLRDGWIEEE